MASLYVGISRPVESLSEGLQSSKVSRCECLLGSAIYTFAIADFVLAHVKWWTADASRGRCLYPVLGVSNTSHQELPAEGSEGKSLNSHGTQR